MSTPEMSPHQRMANALAGYQRVVTEREIREEIPDDVSGWWKLSENLVDGIDEYFSDGRMHPPDHKEILDNLTWRLGGRPPEVGRDMSVSRRALVELCFRDMMEDEINTWLRDTAKMLEHRREYADKVGVPITSPDWNKAFSEYLERDESAMTPNDELLAHRNARLASLSGEEPIADFTGFDIDDFDAQFNRSCFTVIYGGKQETDKP